VHQCNYRFNQSNGEGGTEDIGKRRESDKIIQWKSGEAEKKKRIGSLEWSNNAQERSAEEKDSVRREKRDTRPGYNPQSCF